MYMKLEEEELGHHEKCTHDPITDTKMVNMNGNRIEPMDGCRSVRDAVEIINSNTLQQSSASFNSTSGALQTNGYSHTSSNPLSSISSNTTNITTNNSTNISNNNDNINNNSNSQQGDEQRSTAHVASNSSGSGSINALRLINSYPLNSTSSLVQTLTVALVYYREVTISGQVKSRHEQELPVGTLIIDKALCQRITARQLREKIQKDIPHEHFDDFNTNYVFLTRQGSALEYKHEEEVSAWSVVNSKRQQIRFRLESNIFHVMMSNDIEKARFMLLFSITCPFDKSLKDVRELIRARMLQVTPEKPFCSSSEFYFLCDRRTTVSRNNESHIKLVDILSGTSAIKLLAEGDRLLKMDKFVSSDNLQNALSFSTTNVHQNDHQHADVHRKVSVRKKPSKSSSFLRNLTRTRTSKSTQVMISYARSDMSAYVKELKEELIKLGLSVYLDVDEIKSGQDWQDSLNDAVLNVDYFVPLISQNYGRTKWTNKEVKLADLRQKVIIPINFLEAFPPECLAIQFCTTQYIPWQGVVAHEATNQKFDTWSSENIKLVAKCVHERIQELKTANSIPRSSLIDKTTVEIKKSVSEKIIELAEPEIVPKARGEVQTITQGLRKKITISAHPDQIEEAQIIKALLLDEYDVWISSESIVDQQQYGQPFHSSNKSLDRIPEEEFHVVTNDIRDYARRVGETHRKRVSKTRIMNDSDSRTNFSAKQVLANTGRYTSSLSPIKKEELVQFQTIVAESDLVLIVESQRYYSSRTSEKQVFYLGNRKKIIRITTDNSQPPVWYSKINPQITTTLDYKSQNFEKDLKSNITNVIENKVIIIGEQDGDQVHSLRKAMEGYVSNLEKLVYICGPVDYTKTPRTEALCRAVSAALCDTQKLCPVTSGFYGVSQTIAEMYEEQTRLRTGQNGIYESNKSTDSQIMHLLPVRDPNDCSGKAAQKQDSTFENLPNGRTFFYGNSIEERDTDVAKIIDICIFLGGNKGENVREFEEFRWNDHYVIPIPFTDDGCCDDDPFPSKIYECPKGVTPENWNKLMDINTPPAEVAKTLITVICEIKRHICEHRSGNNVPVANSNRKKRMAKARRQIKIQRPNPNLSSYWETEEGLDPERSLRSSWNNVEDGHESDTSKGKFKMTFKIPFLAKSKS